MSRGGAGKRRAARASAAAVLSELEALWLLIALTAPNGAEPDPVGHARAVEALAAYEARSKGVR